MQKGWDLCAHVDTPKTTKKKLGFIIHFFFSIILIWKKFEKIILLLHISYVWCSLRILMKLQNKRKKKKTIDPLQGGRCCWEAIKQRKSYKVYEKKMQNGPRRIFFVWTPL